MTIYALPALILKGIPDLSSANASYLGPYMDFMMLTVAAKDGPIMETLAALCDLSAQMRRQFKKGVEEDIEVYNRLQNALSAQIVYIENLKDDNPHGDAAADDIDRLLIGAAIMAEFLRRAVNAVESRQRRAAKIEEMRAA